MVGVDPRPGSAAVCSLHAKTEVLRWRVGFPRLVVRAVSDRPKSGVVKLAYEFVGFVTGTIAIVKAAVSSKSQIVDFLIYFGIGGWSAYLSLRLIHARWIDINAAYLRAFLLVRPVRHVGGRPRCRSRPRPTAARPGVLMTGRCNGSFLDSSK
jgi:hypothetical protein